MLWIWPKYHHIDLNKLTRLTNCSRRLFFYLHIVVLLQLLHLTWHFATHGLQHAWLPCPSLSHRVCSYSCPLCWWCHPTISSFVFPFFSHPWSFPASESFPMSQLFASGGQSIGASASASVLPMNIQGWFILGLTGLISLLSNRLSRNFSNTITQKHQSFTAHPSLWSNFYFRTWLLEKPCIRL